MRHWNIEYTTPGIKGMISERNANILAIDREFATRVVNGRFSDSFGSVVKDSGWDISQIMVGAPTNMRRILSMVWFPYEVIDNNGNILRYGRIYIQTDGDPLGLEHGLDYYYREYDYQTGEWGAWSDPQSEENIDGTTKADRIVWTKFPNCIRGACGAEDDSTPLWIGYVSRKAADDNGFFHDYTFGNEHDMREFPGDVVITTALQEVKMGISEPVIYEQAEGGYKRGDYIFLLIPEFDGHQIGVSSLVNDLGVSSFLAKRHVVFGYDIVGHVGFDVRIQWHNAWIASRLTAIYLYRADRRFITGSSHSQSNYSNWLLIRRIDLRDGSNYSVNTDVFTFEDQGSNIGYLEDYGDYTDFEMYVGLWAEIRAKDGDGNEVVERYPITHAWELPGGTTGIRLQFTYDTNTNLIDGTSYSVDIRERWSEPEVDNFSVHIASIGNESLSNSPPWLPDPDKIFEDDYDPLPVFCNYKHSIYFENRHIVLNCFWDGEYHPLMMRYPDVEGSDFGGNDLFSNEHVIPAGAGDEGMGLASTMRILSIFTKYDIFRYMFEDSSAPVLQDTPYNVGLASSISLVTIDGTHFFVGQQGAKISVYKYDGIHEPKRVGGKIQKLLDEYLEMPGVVPEMIKGWCDKNSNQYRIAINQFSSP